MKYQRFDPAPCRFPAARVPVLPTLHAASLGIAPSPGPQGIGGGTRLAYTRGRYALTAALQACGAGPGSTVLAPAYHCRTMLDPALRLGAEVLLYGVEADLAPSMGQIAERLHLPGHGIRAVIATHFFGVVQDFQALRALCDRHAVFLVEDCCHCLPPAMGTQASEAGALGQWGHYSIWSPYKFHPSEDGGELHVQAGAPSPAVRPRARPWRQEGRSALRALQSLLGRRAATPALSAGPASAASGESCGNDLEENSNTPSPHYRMDDEGQQSLRVSRWLIGHGARERLAQQRRQNFRHWQQAVQALPGCRPLLPALPEGTVPYMFPLYLESPQPHFFELKRSGLPIWRWDDMAVSHCTTAMDYRLHLLHLPCHQELAPEQMEWMTRSLVQVLRPSAQPAGI